MDGRAGSVERGEGRNAGDCGDADHAGGALGLEAHADGKDYSGFFEWQNAGLRGDGIELRGRGGVRGGAPAGFGEGQSWRAVSAGRGESDAEGSAGYAGEDHGFAGAGDQNPAQSGVGCSLRGERVFAVDWERAGDSRGRREDRAAQDVCGRFAGAAGIGVRAGAGGGGAGARGAVVSSKWICEGGAGEEDEVMEVEDVREVRMRRI